MTNSPRSTRVDDSDLFSKIADFLYPRSPYSGECKPDYLIFNANLQEFAQRVSYISNLQTCGNLSPKEAYKQIKMLWKQLKHLQKELEID